jgi:prepilin-type N-terminal cleavage/methylation domain-containing protein
MIQVSNRKLLPENRGPEIRRNESGFTLAEVLVTVAICLFFGMAAFATNQRLLYTLRSQKETTAAIMVLQQRRESLRGMAFTDIATADTLKNVIKVPTGSEAPLSNLSETVTVSVDPTDAAYTSPSPTPTVFLRDKNNATPSKISQNNNLPNYDLLRVDILLTWTGSNGRLRSRQSSEIFGHGNVGQ